MKHKHEWKNKSPVKLLLYKKLKMNLHHPKIYNLTSCKLIQVGLAYSDSHPLIYQSEQM